MMHNFLLIKVFFLLYKGCGSQKIESSSSLLCLNYDIIELCEVWERGVGEGHWDCGVAVILRDFLERFSIHCHKTRTKAIWKANHRKENMTISQWNIKLKTRKLSDARENASDHVVIGFSQFDSDWFRKWCEFSRPITKRSKAIPGHFRHSIENYFCTLFGRIKSHFEVLPNSYNVLQML